MPIHGTAQAGTVWYVDAHAGREANTGVSWCTGFLELQDALAAAQEGDEIRVAHGVYRADQGAGQTPGDRSATFRMLDGVALLGGFAGCGAADPDLRDVANFQSLLHGDLLGDDAPGFVNRSDNSYHVVTNDDPNTTSTTLLDGFTIAGGYANGTLAEKTDQGAGFHNFNGINPFSGKPMVRNCTFIDHWAANHGAFNDHGGATLIDCEFRDNHAGMWGGGLYVHEGLQTTVTNCRFINNHTDGTSGGGGGVVNEGITTFTNCLFETNTSSTRGGGLYNHGGATPTLIGCVFTDNTASLQGGALYNIDCTAVVLTGCTFSGNTATEQAGALYSFNNQNTTIASCLFAANAVTGYTGLPDIIGTGGAAYYWRTSGTMTDCTFLGNSATKYAGAMSLAVYSSPTLRRCVFEENSVGGRGGCIDLGINSHPMILDSDFRRNHAGVSGGAFASVAESDPVFVNCTFVDNQADQYGGGLYLRNGTGRYINCLFTGNTANPGGAMNLGSGSGPVFSHCTMADNAAPQGSAVSIDSFQQMYPSSVSFTNSVIWNGPNWLWNNDGSTVNIAFTNVVGGWAGTGNSDVDPVFIDPGNGDYRLSGLSPCIDQASIAYLLADVADLDLDGNVSEMTPMDLAGGARAVGSGLDMGAYELQSGPSIPAMSGWGFGLAAAAIAIAGGIWTQLGRTRPVPGGGNPPAVAA